ncbi:MAG: hypothetical protein DHS20C17_03390 [Cyclobacteriaceae bacterium]|nr:MAG: hypothetical protein DHS20C17_03390 [Cyclobacteriaceae bacterium]
MTPLELAEKYMDCVFNTGDLETLRKILSDDLKFSGPFFKFNSAEDYVNSLRNDPPDGFEYEIKKRYADNSSTCLCYQFSKPGVSTSMAQIFETSNGKISSILLIFDSAVFRPD